MINGIRAVCLLAFLLMLCNLQVCGQTEEDSLLTELEKSSDDRDKVAILLRTSNLVNKADKSLVYAKRALAISNNLDDPLLQAKCVQQLGRWQASLQQFDSAKINLTESIRIFKNLNQAKLDAKSKFYLASLFENQHLLDSAELYYREAIEISDSSGDKVGNAIYNLHLGNMENVRGNNKVALTYLERANDYFDSHEKRDSAWLSLNSLGIVYDEMGLYAKALEYYIKAYEIIEEFDIQNGRIILANNLGTIYHELGKLKEAKDYFAKGLETARINDLKIEEAMLLNNISIVYTEEGDTLKAYNQLRRAHEIQAESNQKCDLAYTCEGLGEVMVWKKDYDSATYYYQEALTWAKKCEILGSQTSIYRNMGLLAHKMGKRKEAERHLLKSLELGGKSNYGLEMKETAKELFNFYNKTNDLENALKYQIMFSNLKDSLFNAESTERIARMTAEYDFRREIESLEYKKMADEMRLNDELRQKESYQNSILVVLVLTTLLAATLGRSYYLVQNHNKKLTALNEEKNTLMGVVAHDLRSPLNNIKGLMSLVKMENSALSPEQSHYFHLVDDTMERMRDMIDRVLDVSVVEDMKVNLNLKKVDLGQTINFVAGNFELLASKKSIRIHSELDINRHIIFADYNYLLQVIENLLSNAIKFSEPGKSIFLNIFQEDGSETMIVRDEGPGISEEDQKRLFNKFQKLSAKPTDNERSTGLGLSIVKKFVDAMEAEISCESELGKGTSFIVRFNTAVETELA
ncbi:MAG: tetratricopeptide repeat-containing sensor histidine kinase [Reichenbachiella sp.]|uniref:ATP-binding protein n=1 Tax=Reichenbachiella sp. TaxID=2184521 RepID=UPI003267B848